MINNTSNTETADPTLEKKKKHIKVFSMSPKNEQPLPPT